MSDPECTPERDWRHLTSYLDVEVPGTYWLEMTFDGTEWLPAVALPMPHHHATRLELTNLSAFPALSAQRTERLRFVIEISSREIHPVAPDNRWRVTYEARILRVCTP